jgi:hypothetical protein
VARKRPIASNVVPPIQTGHGRTALPVWEVLARAEAHARRRSAPLTPDQFKALRRLAQQGVAPEQARMPGRSARSA